MKYYINKKEVKEELFDLYIDKFETYRTPYTLMKANDVLGISFNEVLFLNKLRYEIPPITATFYKIEDDDVTEAEYQEYVFNVNPKYYVVLVEYSVDIEGATKYITIKTML